MERFRHRLKFYLIGFAIGLIIMFMIFGNRGCSWLPGNRVKNMIAEKEIFIGDSLLEVMTCAGVTNIDIYNLLKDEGDVNFSQSVTNTNPKKYLFDGLKEDKPLSITYALFDSVAEVIDFKFEGSQNCKSNLSNHHKTTVPLPDADVRSIIESHEMRILPKATCQIECLGLTEKELYEFHKTATFSVEYSHPRLHPNPEYVMYGTLRNKAVFVTYVIGENFTRISDILPNDCNCSE